MCSRFALPCWMTLILSALALSSNVAVPDDTVEPQTTVAVESPCWKMTIEAVGVRLTPPALQWALFDEDPVSGFTVRIGDLRECAAEQLSEAATESDKDIVRTANVTVAWNLGFKAVTGDNVILLPLGSEGKQTVLSNGPDGKKWVATKIANVDGKAVCWCVPIKVEKGKETRVVLNEDNMLDEAKLGAFHKIPELSPVSTTERSSDILEVRFEGTFEPREQINQAPITTPWINIRRIEFSSTGSLSLAYEAPDRSELNSDIHYLITVEDADGKAHTLVDEDRPAPGPKMSGSATAVLGDGFSSPIPLSGIRSVTLHLTLGNDSVAVPDLPLRFETN